MARDVIFSALARLHAVRRAARTDVAEVHAVFSIPLLPSAPTTSFRRAETVGCVWWRETERVCPEWTDIRGIYISTDVALSISYSVHVLGRNNYWCIHVGACVMSMCPRRERIKVASGLYLPRRGANTRSRCLAGAEYY